MGMPTVATGVDPTWLQPVGCVQPGRPGRVDRGRDRVPVDGHGALRGAPVTAPTVIYITTEPESGKSLVSFGPWRRPRPRPVRSATSVPVIAAGPDRDPVIELMRRRFHLRQDYDDSFGVTTDETRGMGSRWTRR